MFASLKLNTKDRRKIRKLFVDITYPIFRYNLSILARLCGTDKSGFHEYTKLYHIHFNQIRKQNIIILEIGVGGYNDLDYGGNSLRMWKKYFNSCQIFGIDIYDKSNLEEKRIKIFQGDQKDTKFLSDVILNIGNPNIIIDDGSHINQDIIVSFIHLFSYLKSGGMYVIEDTQTSYLDSYGGDSLDIQNPKTTMNYFKQLIDSVNSNDIQSNEKLKSHLLVEIKKIHFYHNIIFIVKE